MSDVLKAEASTVIDRVVEDTWEYISDSDNLDKWFVLQPGEEIRNTSEGPMGLGSTMQLNGKFMGRSMVVDLRVSEFEPNRKVTIEYTSGPFRGSRKTYVMEPDQTGQKTRLTHLSIGEFRGLWKIPEYLLRPIARNGFRKTTIEELDKVSRAASN